MTCPVIAQLVERETVVVRTLISLGRRFKIRLAGLFENLFTSGPKVSEVTVDAECTASLPTIAQ